MSHFEPQSKILSAQDDIGVTEVEPFRSKMLRAVKYTCVLVAIFVALVVAGYFIPADDNLPPNNGTHFEDSEAEYEFQRPRRVKSENILGSLPRKQLLLSTQFVFRSCNLDIK